MVTVKSLQKFTDITDKKSLDEYMYKNPKINFSELFCYISDMSNTLVKQGKHPSEEWQQKAQLLVYFTKNYGMTFTPHSYIH